MFLKPDPVTGLTSEDGRTLRELVEADPGGLLGPAPAVLVTLLDPAERLPAHFHPGGFEGWIITEVEGGETGEIRLGFGGEQGSLNRVRVRPGDCYLVPAGVPHAAGPGIAAISLRRPAEPSLDTAAGAPGLDRGLWDGPRLAGLRTAPEMPGVTRIFDPVADPCFRAERLHLYGPHDFPAGFSVIVALTGEATLDTAEHTVELGPGSVVVVPYGAGPHRLTGDLHAVRCLPPAVP